MRVAIFTNSEKLGAKEIAEKVKNKLLACKVEIIDKDKSEKEIFLSADVLITVGGDGTLINYAKKAATYGKPILGVNAGRLGFLTDVEADNLDLLERLASGEYTTEKRMMIKVSVIDNGKEVFSDIALNDIIISGGDIARIADIEVNVGKDVISYRADGIIISTPTGSTAYSMSAGGPIIDPSMRCFNLTPICSHSLTARPMMINEGEKIEVTIPSITRTAVYLGVDGIRYNQSLKKQKIVLEKCNFDVKLINLSGKIYLERVGADNPFTAVDELLEKARADGAKITVVDFHAEATSEKRAMGFYLDGKVSVVFGTHTHIQTADEEILEGGTGYITDLGMTGPKSSVLGVKTEIIINRLRDNDMSKFVFADGECQLCGCIFDIDVNSGKCKFVERIKV